MEGEEQSWRKVTTLQQDLTRYQIKTVWNQEKLDKKINGTEQNPHNYRLTKKKDNTMEQRWSSQQVVLEQLDIHRQKNELDTERTPSTKSHRSDHRPERGLKLEAIPAENVR